MRCLAESVSREAEIGATFVSVLVPFFGVLVKHYFCVGVMEQARFSFSSKMLIAQGLKV